MNSTPSTDHDGSDRPEGIGKKIVILIIKITLCTAIIAAGVATATYLTRTAPKAVRKPPAQIAPLVHVATVHPEDRSLVIPAMGTVVPALELTLKSRVAGEVVEVHPQFTEGGFVKKGELLVRLDDADYRLDVEVRKTAVVNARYALDLEQGRQEVAKREWEILSNGESAESKDAELALRKPHLRKALADLAAAEADLEQARLNLSRTRIHAPFNGVIRNTSVETGGQVSAQGALADLVGTDEYWVQASVPVDRLRWIRFPEGSAGQGARARIFHRGDRMREGTVIRLLADLESEGRMARLLISVPDPLDLKPGDTAQTKLLIGEYVRLEIEGPEIAGAYKIPRAALRDDRRLWIATPGDTLEIRDVTPVWRDTATVLLTGGLSPGERLIVSDLSFPVPGMPLNVDTTLPADGAGKPDGSQG